VICIQNLEKNLVCKKYCTEDNIDIDDLVLAMRGSLKILKHLDSIHCDTDTVGAGSFFHVSVIKILTTAINQKHAFE
jgi:hypothetical protein